MLSLQFLKADGSPYDSPEHDPAYPLPSDWREIVRTGDRSPFMETSSIPLLEITPTTAISRWRRESMDYGFAAQTLLLQAKRALNAPLTPQR